MTPGTAILLYIPEGYMPDFSLAENRQLFGIFAKKIAALKLPVHLCVGNESLAQLLHSSLSSAKMLKAEGELSAIRTLFHDAAMQHIAVVGGIYPLLDTSLAEKLFNIHTEYRADITYGENLPPGIAPYFVSRDLLESLEIMEADDADVNPIGVRAFVEKNINQFHAEVHYEEPDLRLLRLDFSLSNARSLARVKNILPLLSVENPPYAQLKPTIDAHPEILVNFPSYIEIEFVSTSEHVGFFSPLRVIEQPRYLLSRAHLAKVIAYLQGGFGDTSVCASGLGEPLEHPECVEYITMLLETPALRYVFIETNGFYLDKLLPLTRHPQAQRLRVIAMLNSLERFSELSGAPAAMLERFKKNLAEFTAALRNAGHNPLELVYLQALKVNENETEIDVLYALAEELGASFLLQKYNRYAGLLPERRVSDMTPLERYSCWHLRRDLFIRANGEVAFCKQTVEQRKNSARGNLEHDDLAALWLKQREDFVANYRENYPAHLPCAACDEYFTFNF